MEDKLVTLESFNSPVEAEFAKDMLEENGIKSEIVGHNLDMLPYLVAANTVELKVFACDVDKAKEILLSQPDAEPGEIDE